MDDLFPDIHEDSLERAKQRIWNKMEPKLPSRSLTPYQNTLRKLRSGMPEMPSRLVQVQNKEALLEKLPTRKPVFQAFLKRATASLSFAMVLLAFLVPFPSQTQIVAASSNNMLEIDQGSVLLNGVEVKESSTLITEGDVIETQPGALAHLKLMDDSRVSLAPESSVTLKSLHASSKSSTGIVLEVEGQVWAQSVNLSSKYAYLEIQFPSGKASLNPISSISIQSNEEGDKVEVARNLVDIETSAYTGTIGQGAGILLSRESNEVIGSEIFNFEDDQQGELWWNYNLAYGKAYTRLLDERYTQEAIKRVTILPGNPFYPVKTFREDVHEALASGEQKKELIVKHSQNRLAEAKVLISQGRDKAAETALKDFNEIVVESVEKGESETLEALEEVVKSEQKELMVSDLSKENESINDAVDSAALTLTDGDISESSEVLAESASQKLARIPDLISEGEIELALTLLEEYQSTSLSILKELDAVPQEEREAVIADLLESKLSDLSTLRAIARTEALQDFDAEAVVYSDLSGMVLSLRESSFTSLSEFFNSSNYDVSVQRELFERLMGNSQLSEEVTEQMEVASTVLESTDIEDAKQTENELNQTTGTSENKVSVGQNEESETNAANQNPSEPTDENTEKPQPLVDPRIIEIDASEL